MEGAAREGRDKALHLREGEEIAFMLDNTYAEGSISDSRHNPVVAVTLSYDGYGLKIDATVNDIRIDDGERSWRYGDGFFINFATPENPEEVYTDRCFGIGFSLERGKPVAILVNKDKTHPYDTEAVPAPSITIDEDQNSSRYRMIIPWESVYPFHPLMHGFAGINIIYTSRNESGSRSFTSYLRDVSFDTEITYLRRFAPITFQPSAKSGFRLTGALNRRVVTAGAVDLRLAAFAPERINADIRVILINEDTGLSTEYRFTEEIEAGKSVFTRKIVLPAAAGVYRLKAVLNGAVHWEDVFFRLDEARLKELKKNIGAMTPSSGSTLAEAGENALIFGLMEWERQVVHITGREREEPLAIRRDFEELYSRNLDYEREGSFYSKDGMAPAAFLSTADGTLQPYSVYLPEGFDPDRPCRVVLALHGSGCDETQIVQEAGSSLFLDENTVVFGPRGRDVSHWYTDASEIDVIDVARRAGMLFRVDKLICCGHSMGGYGTWRTVFLHPELFDAAIVLAGRPDHVSRREEEYDMGNLIGRAQDIPFLVIHGTADISIPIELTDRFVEKLAEAGYDVTYHRIPNAGHMDVIPMGKDIMNEWLRERFGN
jgi:predicted esterase